MKSQGIGKVNGIHPLRTMKVWTNFGATPCHRCGFFLHWLCENIELLVALDEKLGDQSIMCHLLRNMNICAKFIGNPFNIHQDSLDKGHSGQK